jgi:hypothetical protein
MLVKKLPTFAHNRKRISRISVLAIVSMGWNVQAEMPFRRLRWRLGSVRHEMLIWA